MATTPIPSIPAKPGTLIYHVVGLGAFTSKREAGREASAMCRRGEPHVQVNIGFPGDPRPLGVIAVDGQFEVGSSRDRWGGAVLRAAPEFATSWEEALDMGARFFRWNRDSGPKRAQGAPENEEE